MPPILPALARKQHDTNIGAIQGTSVKMIEEHYGHLVPDAHERTRAMLDLIDAESKAAAAK